MMKKRAIFCAALALAALSLASCQKEEQTVSHQFFATTEASHNSKFAVDNSLHMYWDTNRNDAESHVLIWAINNGAIAGASDYTPSNVSADGCNAVLTHHPQGVFPEFPDGQQGPFFAISTSVGLHNYANGVFSVTPATAYSSNTNSYCMPMMGYASDYGELKFKHLMGVLKVEVTMPAPSNFLTFYAGTEMDISCTNDDYDKCAAGDYQVSWDENGNFSLLQSPFKAWEDYGWSTPTPYKVASLGNGCFWIPMPVGDVTDLKIHMVGSDNTGATHHFVKTMRSDASIRIERATITTVNISYDVENIRDMDYLN